MDAVSFILNADNLRMLFLFVAMVTGFVWLDRRTDSKIAVLGKELRQEIEALAKALRQEIDERFNTFHKLIKENDFKHLNDTIKALTFTLQKNKILDPEDKKFVDSHLDDK